MSETSQQPTSTLQRIALLSLLILIAVGSVVAIWWYRPANAENRFSRMSLVNLRQLLDRDPNNSKAWRQFALRLARDGDGAMAEPALERALVLNPNDPLLSTGLGEMYMAADRYPEAFQLLMAATEAHPKDATTHRALGELYVRKVSYHHAYEAYSAVVLADPGADDAWYQMAACSLQMQQFAKAQDAITHALALKPTDPVYIVEKGAVDVALGKVSDGIAETERAAQLVPNDIRIQSALIDLMLEQHRDAGDLATAEDAIGHLEQLSPNFPPIPYMRGKLEMLRQNWPAAVRFLEIAWQSAPQHDEVCLALSQTYRRVNRTTEAEALLKLYRRRQDIRKQIVDIQDELGAEPRSVALYKKLVDLEMQLGDRIAAVEVLKTGLQIVPNEAELQKLMQLLQPAAPAPQ